MRADKLVKRLEATRQVLAAWVKTTGPGRATVEIQARSGIDHGEAIRDVQNELAEWGPVGVVFTVEVL